jgi:3-hydroxyisobutyrate dehydrogenase-like beta-hydroxyacid dehydrogenase
MGPDTRGVEEILEQITPALAEGVPVIEMSTIALAGTRRVGERLRVPV